MPAFGEQFKAFYSGLVPIETALWRAWLAEHESEWDRFDYNVHVGQGINVSPRSAPDDPELSERLREMFRALTQKKIDVVGWQRSRATIFEVEERPGTRALGQLLHYAHLLPRQVLLMEPPALAVVCRRIGPDTREVFEAEGVRVWQVVLRDLDGR